MRCENNLAFVMMMIFTWLIYWCKRQIRIKQYGEIDFRVEFRHWLNRWSEWSGEPFIGLFNIIIMILWDKFKIKRENAKFFLFLKKSSKIIELSFLYCDFYCKTHGKRILSCQQIRKLIQYWILAFRINCITIVAIFTNLLCCFVLLTLIGFILRKTIVFGWPN